ncbi:Hypothetical protein CpP54B96_0077 [Corynebacterium pseudotuberculosis P54B96]|nr:Hypothetical protein CpPAT10_0072a [Corynebacterium pseudotuberculosis PAT10]AFF21242.1 Hypothetical protein CpP54B96_0077 [Corynebacterium pseudotuberculosis P54B96]
MSCDMGDMNDMTPNFDVLKKINKGLNFGNSC